MNRLIAALALVSTLFAANIVQAGPLFDDYLNYVRPGTGTGPGKAVAKVKTGSPIGQSFTVPSGTGEIYRIGVRPVYDTWQPGESVTMTLYDSPEKKIKLGDYTIDEATCHVDQYVIGNGSKFRETGDRVLYFQFRKATEGRSQLYFELSAKGGDGSVSFQAFDNDAYAGGQSYGDAADISFECDIKPVPDREANLKAFFTERLDISRPELSAVKAAVEAGDWEKAIAETVKHFHNRMELWSAWKDVMQPKIDPNADTSLADLLLKSQVRNADTGQPIPWRKESWWAGEIPGTKQPKKGIDPSPFTWHFDRVLAGAYTTTGKPEYARKAIELRIQFILDNPNPKIVYKTEEFPWYFELWNDRTAAARTPGHGDLVYARLYNFPEWTNDQKLVFLAFIEDNARWVYKATSGANWGAEAARGCMDFGINFPEWKLSPKYREWGASRLAEIVLEDVRKDGTSTEAAIKYHAMVARRLKSMIEDCQAGKVSLAENTRIEVEKYLAAMYDHMAYTLQPNSYVVMCGDSWYENYTPELAEVGKMINRPDFAYIATQGKQGTPPTETSKVYPDGGYFIMRSDFGGNGRDYQDSRQLFIHNGNWFGSHGHPDFLSVNLYGYGRTLVIDPGQYDYKPPEGIDVYWNSKIHSTMVCEGRDMDRAAGPSEWATTSVIDWFDGISYGYSKLGNVDYTRRRIAFVKPNYFLIDDSAKTTRDTEWTQVWNLTDPEAKIDLKYKTIETTFRDGGNLLIMSQDPEGIRLEEAKGITAASDAYPKTKIVRLHRKTADPRFVALLYPYKSPDRPNVSWERITPDDTTLSNLFYSVRVRVTPSTQSATRKAKAETGNAGIDWVVFGQSGKSVTYRNGLHRADADFTVVRMDSNGKVKSFAWAHGRELVFNKQTLASAKADIHSLAVTYEGPKLIIEAREPDPTLAVRIGSAKIFVINGKIVAAPSIKNGMCYPFAEMPPVVTADDRDAFEKITKTQEWERVADPASYAVGYTKHETDPGRHEEGDYVFVVPQTRTYRVEVYLPKTGVTPSDAVEYRIPAMGKPAIEGGPIVRVRGSEGPKTITVNQQAQCGWVSLGEFTINAGEFRINARNVTETDGLYFIADAMRLVAL